jgi:tyrosyl-tRNA synthetase
MEIKRELARSIVNTYHDSEKALAAERHFDSVVVKKGVPDNIPVFNLIDEDTVVNILHSSGLLKSKGEVRRMIKQGAVTLNGEKVNDIYARISKSGEQIFRIGKRKFLKII